MLEWINATTLRRRAAIILFLSLAAVVLAGAKRTSLYEERNLLSAGKPAPEFTLRNRDNFPVRLGEMRNSVLWVIFGRIDHDGTILQLREAKKIAEKSKDSDLAILLLVQSETRDEVQRYIDQNGCPAAVLFDVGGKVAKTYRVQDWPTSYLIDKSGFIRERHHGVWSADDRALTRGLREYLNSGKRPSRPEDGAGGTQP
jgi:cytochrome c biogenesis protein CcmG, thiol:disulfide interchange protein DsbE